MEVGARFSNTHYLVTFIFSITDLQTFRHVHKQPSIDICTEKQYSKRLEQLTSIFFSRDEKYTSRTLLCMFVGYIIQRISLRNRYFSQVFQYEQYVLVYFTKNILKYLDVNVHVRIKFVLQVRQTTNLFMSFSCMVNGRTPLLCIPPDS